MARPSPAGVPLAFRLPNPPALLIGREAEAAQLGEWLKGGPVAVIRGPAGIGKTALALHVTHGARRRRPETVRWLRLGAGDPGRLLLRALAPPGEADPDDWARLTGDPDGPWTAVLDLAEALGAWVVIDADGSADAPFAALALLAQYARKSRWLLTTRAAPGAALADCTLRLGDLDRAQLDALAAEWAPEREAAHRAAAAEAAAGSPGWLRRALTLSTAQLADPGTRGRLMAAGPLPEGDPAAMGFLVAVAAADEALPAEAAPACPAETIDRLARQGLVEARPGGWGTHPAVRRLVGEAAVEARAAIERAVAERLAGLDRPGAALDAVRLFLAHGEAERAGATLRRTGDAILASGGAPALWAALARHSARPVAVWRLRAAIDGGDRDAPASLGPPEGDDPEVRLAWARVLIHRGELDAAVAAADAVTAPALRDEAAGIAARALMNGGRLAEARARLEAMADPSAAIRILLLVCRAALGEAGAVDDARALLGRLDLLADDPAPRRVGLTLASLLYRAGHLRDTLRIVDALALHRPLTLRAPGVQVMLLAINLAAGRLDAAARQVEALGPLAGGASLLGPFVEVAGVALRLMRGELMGLTAEMHRLVALAGRHGRPELQCFAMSLADDLARDRGEPPGPFDPHDPALAPHAALARLVRARLLIHRGAPPGPLPEAPVHVEVRVIAALTRAAALLAAGEGDRATAPAMQARIEAEREGIVSRAVEALEAVIDAQLIAGRRAAAAESARALVELAARIGSPRFTDAAAWRVAVCAEPPDLAALERLAGCLDRAPTAARRARALLGDDTVSLDVIDRRVIDALRCQPDWPVIEGPRARWQPGWGLDRPRRRAWLPDGRWVELEAKATQWALLEALVDGAGDKESLVQAVWSEASYHPLRHDNRLHATVRLVRRALADPDPPVRVLTTEDGYRLGGPLRVVRGLKPQR